MTPIRAETDLISSKDGYRAPPSPLQADSASVDADGTLPAWITAGILPELIDLRSQRLKTPLVLNSSMKRALSGLGTVLLAGVGNLSANSADLFMKIRSLLLFSRVSVALKGSGKLKVQRIRDLADVLSGLSPAEQLQIISAKLQFILDAQEQMADAPHAKEVVSRWQGYAPTDLDKAAVTRASFLYKIGLPGRATSALQATAAPLGSSPDLEKKLDELHPHHSHLDCGPISPPPPLPVHLDPFHVEMVLGSRAKGGAAGPDGLSYEILEHLAKSSAALSGFTAVLEQIMTGQVPGDIREWLCAARLVPLGQPNSGKVRPIAIMSVVARMVGALLMMSNHDSLQGEVGKQQHGVAGSASDAVLSVQALWEEGKLAGQQLAVVCLDIKNAFNSISRHAALSAMLAAKSLESMHSFAHLLYGADSLLLPPFPSSCLVSREGVKQGDPLAPLMFCLAVKPVLDGLQLIARNQGAGGVVAFMDDITIVCHPDLLPRVSHYLKSVLPPLGLTINDEKSHVFSDSLELQSSTLPFDSSCVELFPLLGSVVRLQPEPAPTLVSESLSSLKAGRGISESMCWRLGAIPAQEAFRFLQHQSYGRTVNLMQTVPPPILRPFSLSFDAKFFEMAKWILQISCPLETAFLPFSEGGLGLLPTSLVGCAHFSAAAARAFGRCKLGVNQDLHAELPLWQSAEAAWKQFQGLFQSPPPCVAAPFESLVSTLSGPQQKIKKTPASVVVSNWLSSLWTERSEQQMDGSAAGRDKARMYGCRNVVLSPMACQLDDHAFLAAVHLRNGSNMPTMCPPPNCVLGHPIHSMVHYTYCKAGFTNLPLHRHNALVAELHDMLLECGCMVQKEPVLRGTDGRNYRGDLWLEHQGKAFVIDVSIVCPLAQTNLLKGERAAPGATMRKATERKMAQYATLATQSSPSAQFVPFIMNTFGMIGKEAKQFVHKMVEWMVEAEGSNGWNDRISLKTQGIYARLARKLHVMNGRMISRACPTHATEPAPAAQPAFSAMDDVLVFGREDGTLSPIGAVSEGVAHLDQVLAAHDVLGDDGSPVPIRVAPAGGRRVQHTPAPVLPSQESIADSVVVADDDEEEDLGLVPVAQSAPQMPLSHWSAVAVGSGGQPQAGKRPRASGSTPAARADSSLQPKKLTAPRSPPMLIPPAGSSSVLIPAAGPAPKPTGPSPSVAQSAPQLPQNHWSAVAVGSGGRPKRLRTAGSTSAARALVQPKKLTAPPRSPPMLIPPAGPSSVPKPMMDPGTAAPAPKLGTPSLSRSAASPFVQPSGPAPRISPGKPAPPRPRTPTQEEEEEELLRAEGPGESPAEL